MADAMSSRQRLLAALDRRPVDHVPLAFMIFGALQQRLHHARRGGDPRAVVEAQLEMGIDAVVDLTHYAPFSDVGHSDLPGLPVRHGPGVRVRTRLDTPAGARYPVLHKDYDTPNGALSVTLDRTDDWPYDQAADGSPHVPFLDDYLEPRCTRHLVQARADLAALRHLLAPPSADDIEACRRVWAHGRALARERDLLLAGGWGVGGDALAWFCGLEAAVLLAMDDPGFLQELLEVVAAWNLQRMEVILDTGVDLFVRRAWYEGTDFWSPALFERLFAPLLRDEIRLAHEAGARFGYILTSGSAPLHEALIELGVDVLIGPDPVQGKDTDLRRMGRQLQGRMATWGGVNGFVTVEMGTPQDIDAAVRAAVDALGPEGFILSPVDNVRDPSDAVWANVLALVEAWRRCR